jgi:hypothetical protein
MNTVLLVGLFLSNIVLVALIYGLARRLHTIEARITANITTFLSAPDDKTPSPLAQLIDNVAAVVASRAASSAMAVIRGSIGGTMKGVNSEAISEASQMSPGLALAATLAPKQFRRLGKNPLALRGLDGLLGKIVGGLGANGQGTISNIDVGDVGERIRRRH